MHDQSTKTCKDCGHTLPLTDFYANENMRDGRLSWCKKCTYKRYRPGVAKRAKAIRERMAAIKLERGCADCGYNEHAVALDFDHLPGHEKLHRVATMASGLKWSTIEAELAKCEVVCANCHRVRTEQRGHNRKEYKDSLKPSEPERESLPDNQLRLI